MLPLTAEDKFVPLDLTDSQRNVALVAFMAAFVGKQSCCEVIGDESGKLAEQEKKLRDTSAENQRSWKDRSKPSGVFASNRTVPSTLA